VPLIGAIGEEKFKMSAPNSRVKAGWLFFLYLWLDCDVVMLDLLLFDSYL